MSWRVLVLALLIPLVAHATPVGERLQQVIDAPLSVDPVRDNDAVGTSLVAAVGVENTKKSAGDTQLFVVTNLHASHNLCFGTVSAVGATCNDTLCDTADSWTAQGYTDKMNCTNGDASQGSLIPAGQSRTFRYEGTRCACIVASGSATTTQVERVVR